MVRDPAREQLLRAQRLGHHIRAVLGPSVRGGTLRGRPAGLRYDGRTTAAVARAAAPNSEIVRRKGSSSGSVSSAVDAILDALEGYTSSWDSSEILARFQDQKPERISAILKELQGRAGDHGTTPEGMVEWLFDDLTAEDERSLRAILVESEVVGHLSPKVAGEILDFLGGYTSESDSAEIWKRIQMFQGSELDGLLKDLEAASGKGPEDLEEWLFDDLDRATGERLRRHLLEKGSLHAVGYGARATAARIGSLLSGYTSHADSSSIVRLFRETPSARRQAVLEQLDSQVSENAGEWLMEDLSPAGYRQLLEMGGLRLPAYEDRRSWWDKALSVAEWGLVLGQWIGCGLVGVVTGLLSVLWDFLAVLGDVLSAAKHLLGSIVYLLSGGAAGSSDWLAVKDFFAGIGALFSDPGAAFDQIWTDLKLELTTIEGPFSDCRKAEFVVRKFVNALVNTILIVAAGYGLAKGATSTAQGAAKLAAEARTVGVGKTLMNTGSKALGAVGKVATGTAEAVAKIWKVVRHPLKSLRVARKEISLLLRAAREEDVWTLLRRQAKAQLAREKEFWQENRRFWRERAQALEKRRAALRKETAALDDELGRGKTPPDGEAKAKVLADDTQKLQEDIDALREEMVADARGGKKRADGETTQDPAGETQSPDRSPEKADLDEPLPADRPEPLPAVGKKPETVLQKSVRIGEEAHDLRLVRRADGSYQILLCSEPCRALVQRIEDLLSSDTPIGSRSRKQLKKARDQAEKLLEKIDRGLIQKAQADSELEAIRSLMELEIRSAEAFSLLDETPDLGPEDLRFLDAGDNKEVYELVGDPDLVVAV
ncbi:MAG: hypothetical protein MI919_30515, partial [Holophagales bacterium]|nr:hypothetical protein [Holophagales bacterium]